MNFIFLTENQSVLIYLIIFGSIKALVLDTINKYMRTIIKFASATIQK